MSDGTESLMYEQSNLTVDGAGESIVDMLTTPSSLLPTLPRLFDSSNWGIKALSFGPAKENFGLNPVFAATCSVYDDFGIDGNVVGAPASYVTSTLLNSASFWINADMTNPDNRIVRALYVSGSQENTTASSYTPPYKLPGYPDPSNKKLEDASTAYSVLSNDGTQSFGQFENRLEHNQSAASAYVVGAYAIGRTPTTADDFHVALVSSLEGDFVFDRTLNIVASSNIVGNTNAYNGRGNVDYRGFVRVEPIAGAEDYYASWSPGTNDSQWQGRAWVSGVGTQTDASSFALDPRIRITTKLNHDDVKMFNMFGGLHHIGLWAFDAKKCLANSLPPYGWDLDSVGANDREYRLFAKKTFTDNLARIIDVVDAPGIDAYGQLVIKWTVDLRSYR